MFVTCLSHGLVSMSVSLIVCVPLLSVQKQGETGYHSCDIMWSCYSCPSSSPLLAWQRDPGDQSITTGT